MLVIGFICVIITVDKLWFNGFINEKSIQSRHSVSADMAWKLLNIIANGLYST